MITFAFFTQKIKLVKKVIRYQQSIKENNGCLKQGI